MKVSIKKRITATGNQTTNVIATSAMLYQIVIAVANAGTTWKLSIQDKDTTPAVLVPETTLSAPTTPTAGIINFPEPIYMIGGIDIVTSGTSGIVALWFDLDDGK